MTHASTPVTCTVQHYPLPDDAHQRLTHARDHLYLLARLAAGRSHHDDLPGNELQIAPAPLSQCFLQLAQDLDYCLLSTRQGAHRAA